ncbi:MAG: urease accessory protein UreD, partial [Actinomycetes bacterium]
MHAHALLTAETRRTVTGSRTFLTDLRSHPPIVLRQTSTGRIPCADGTADALRVCIAAGAAGPLGGDRFRLDVRVGDGGSLLLTEVSSTMLLP